MHRFSPETGTLAQAILEYALERVRLDPPPLDGWLDEATLDRVAGETVTAEGIGADAALRLFAEVLAPATISQDHPRNLAFVPCAPTEAAVLFDLVVSASCIFAGTWVEASGAVWAENAALRWLCDIAGLPSTAGGVFVSGGSAANLSALVAARHRYLGEHGRPPRLRIAISEESHASVTAAARVMDVDVLEVPTVNGRLVGADLARALDSDGEGVFAVVATAGTTNAGVVDDLAGSGRECTERSIWFHVDAAYGGAALCAPSVRHLFDGVEQADSVTIDPHKWLFAPFDCAALLYREPAVAREAHAQTASYLDPVTSRQEWNPSEYAYHLTRRARGLPFWFSLAAHGTDAYRDAVEACLRTAGEVAGLVARDPRTELAAEPSLSVVLFRRCGWTPAEYHAWSLQALADQVAWVAPTTFKSETVFRLCIVNPTTTIDDVAALVATM